jgi:dihydrofolate reductase
MRTLIVTAFVSADGVMEGPGGGDYRNAGWTFNDVTFDEAAYELKGREQRDADLLLMGRRSYEEFAPAWPSMQEFARYNTLPRYVVSRTLTVDDPRWPATARFHETRRESSLDPFRRTDSTRQIRVLTAA